MQEMASELTLFRQQAQAPVLRTMSQWVEDSIVLPNGPFAGEHYRHHRHPVSRLWFDAVDSGRWSRFAGTGPTQNGKTLMLYVAPVLYHLFEIGETVIVGLPTLDMANDKWQQDFLPVINASRYRDLLPLKGEGSKGGQVKRSITFRNGASLRFMSGGGGDKKRAGYTARVLAVTETDGMDEAGTSSREADKIEQLEGRTRAFGRTGKRVFLECTVSIETGRIWQEVKRGTDSRIARPCPHCEEFVTPEREHLAGWDQAENEEQAAELAYWSCPACGEAWTDVERLAAARDAVLLHRGQAIDAHGEVTGDLPATQTLGLRWSAVDNPFVTAADLGAEEWLARKNIDHDNAERKMRQFVYALPHEPAELSITPLNPDDVQARIHEGTKRGIVPTDTIGLVIGIDTGKNQLHWECKAVRTNGAMVTIEYDIHKTSADRLGIFRGLVGSLRELSAYFEKGWVSTEGKRYRPSQVWIDSGYHEHTDAVYAVCGELNKDCQPGTERYRPSKGYGEGQRRMTQYRAPAAKAEDVLYIGREMYIARVRRNGRLLSGVALVHVNSDYWKSEFHQRLSRPPTEPGAITLFEPASQFEHAEYAAHSTAERQIEKQMPSKRMAIVWETVRRQNHFLDTGYLSTAAGALLFENYLTKSTSPPRTKKKRVSYL